VGLLEKVTRALSGKTMETLQAGTQAPVFTLSRTDGTPFSLEAALAKGPVVAAFFKVSCPVCQFTFPFLERLYQACGNERVSFLGISQDNARDTREFCKEFGVTFPALVDAQGYPVSNAYGLTIVPTIFLIAPDGKILLSSTGFSRSDLEKLSSELARHLGRPALPLFHPDESVPYSKPG
jgi:peroxiredoxin